MIIRNARVITFDCHNTVLECGAVAVDGGKIEWVGSDDKVMELLPREDAIDAGGRVLMPALINCHTHLYSSLACGIQLKGKSPANFLELLKKLWWKLDRALDEEDVYLSAMVGLIDSAKAGVGTLFDHHSSPEACTGSLDVVERAFREVGLRGCLCYETSDRNGRKKTLEAIAENLRFIEKITSKQAQDTIGAAFGLHASFTLSDKTLAECVNANESKAGFHIHVAEDRSDVEYGRKHFKKTPVRRLVDAGVLSESSIAAHCVHVSKADIALLAESGASVVHNPQSNCNNAVGIAAVGGLLQNKVRVGLGSDGYTSRLLDEFAAAFHLMKVRAEDPRVGYAETLCVLMNNRKIADRVCGWKLGTIESGACADLALIDYYPATPLSSENLFGHLLFGIARSHVDSLWVNGNPVLKSGRCVAVDEHAIREKAAMNARKIWSRM